MEKQILAISDIHGMLDAFNELLAKCYDPSKHQLILLGDYTDRGPDSKGVVKKVKDLVENDGAIALMGNHDEWFMACGYHSSGFNDDIWLMNGGDKTIASYNDPYELQEDARWMINNLKKYHETDDYIFVHATVRPKVPMEEQKTTDLLWMRHNAECGLGKLIVHGHTPMQDVTRIHDQLFIDTGSCFKNKLSAVLFPEMEIFEVSTK